MHLCTKKGVHRRNSMPFPMPPIQIWTRRSARMVTGFRGNKRLHQSWSGRCSFACRFKSNSTVIQVNNIITIEWLSGLTAARAFDTDWNWNASNWKWQRKLINQIKFTEQKEMQTVTAAWYKITKILAHFIHIVACVHTFAQCDSLRFKHHFSFCC